MAALKVLSSIVDSNKAAANPILSDARWYQAATLLERAAGLKDDHQPRRDAAIDPARARKQMQRWRSQAPFSDENSYLQQKLEMDHLTEEDLFYLLGEPIEAVSARLSSSPPHWLKELAEAFAGGEPAAGHANGAAKDAPAMNLQESAVFLTAIRPVLQRAEARLRAGIASLSPGYATLPFDMEQIVGVLHKNLVAQLLSIVSRTMVLELHIARLRGQLHGDTPTERFASFALLLNNRETALSILQEYSVMTRQLVKCIENWAVVSLEFLDDLCADWKDLTATFSPDKELGELVDLQGNKGDSHRGGRSVMFAVFRSGVTVVYKPRSLSVDVHFQQLLEWLNAHGAVVPFRTLKIIDRAAHGWIEYVSAAECTSHEELTRFYQRQGGYLALLYALEATDFHYENLIADGEQPILIDLESLFHPRVDFAGDGPTAQALERLLINSVLRVGLLPQRVWANNDSEGIDISGLGTPGGQITPHTVPTWENVATDEMRFVRKHLSIPEGQNRPHLNGQDVDVLTYSEDIAHGFRAVYQLLLQNREELLSENGPLARFKDDEVRVIVRPTRAYVLTSYESFHPDFLRDGLTRDLFFNRLWVGVDRQPYLKRLILSEYRDLSVGDVPIFTTRLTTRHLWDSANGCIEDFLDEPGWALVRRRIEQLSEDDLRHQLWVVNASLATLGLNDKEVFWKGYTPKPPQSAMTPERLMQAARAIGDRLDFLAMRDGDLATWLGLQLAGERHWKLAIVGFPLYDGSSGIVLFLAYLGALTGEKRYIELAQAGLKSARQNFNEVKSLYTAVGGFNGWGALIYLLSHLGSLWHQPELFEEAEELLEPLSKHIAQDKNLDIISGAAGCLASLLSLYHCRPSERVRSAAVLCGERLLECARPMEQGGIAWDTVDASRPLAGFSHGAAGISLALLELAALTGDERFHLAALAGMTYEKSTFSAEVGNWLDFRSHERTGKGNGLAVSDDDLAFMVAWCHGAPGIGLARLEALPYLDNEQIRFEIETALTTTYNHGFGLNHSLCHGDLGNIDLFVQACLKLDDAKCRERLAVLSAVILESIDEHGWLTGVPNGVENPALMTGISGIGYGLLRLLDPVRVPSVLLLEPPRLSVA